MLRSMRFTKRLLKRNTQESTDARAAENVSRPYTLILYLLKIIINTLPSKDASVGDWLRRTSKNSADR